MNITRTHQNIIQEKMGGASFRFTHDHIEQATYSLWDTGEREALHLQIAWIFFEKYKTLKEDQDKYIFTITNHFNKAVGLLKTKADKLLVIRLNEQAAQQAQKANAYETALVYYKTGLNIMDDWGWENHHFPFTFYYQYAECAYLTGKFKVAHDLYNKLLLQQLDSLDKAEIYYAFSGLCIAEGKLEEAQNCIFSSLDLLEIEYPIGESETIQELANQAFKLASLNYERVNEEKILNAPMIVSKRENLLLKIFTKLDNIYYLLKKITFCRWVSSVRLNIILNKGNGNQASYAFFELWNPLSFACKR